MNEDSQNELDRLLDRLEAARGNVQNRDAIDRILATEARRTETVSLRDHEVAVHFRRELAEGRLQAKTVARLLDLVGAVLGVILK